MQKIKIPSCQHFFTFIVGLSSTCTSYFVNNRYPHGVFMNMSSELGLHGIIFISGKLTLFLGYLYWARDKAKDY